ncbi:MAG: valine--tRNA ligase, partial [Chloroflexota bacterium]
RLRSDGEPRPEQSAALVLANCEVYLPLQGMIDSSAERERLTKELVQEQAEAARLEAKLGNGSFVARAPQPVVAKERERLAAAQERVERLQARLRDLG